MTSVEDLEARVVALEAVTDEQVNARLDALEVQVATQTDALRYLIEGRWTGEMPHAAALISSLYGPDGAPEPYTPQPFPKVPESPPAPEEEEGETPGPAAEIQPVWFGSPNHYDGRKGYSVVAIVVHTMAGSLVGCDSWFANPQSQVSSHYGVGLGGELHQYVELQDGAWANGVLEPGATWTEIVNSANPNYQTVSIETEDLGNPKQEVTEEQFEATAAACRLALEMYPGIKYLMTHTVISPQSRPNCCGARWVDSGRFDELADLFDLEPIVD